MTRDPRYDILFEPVRIGPVTAPNRFYQVPHCNGMGHQYPSSMAEMRGIKAEGGWGVVNTEEAEIHHTSELSGVIEARLWDDSDIPALARMCERVHVHGALAGIELAHLGMGAANNYSREVPIGPSARPIDLLEPVQSRAMDKADIKAFRKMHVDAALRSKKAGFDIVYVYAGHDMTTLMHFLTRDRNDRMDEYGGSLENRVRLMREVLEDTKEAVGDSCAVAIRLAVDEMKGEGGLTSNAEGREIVEMLADLPDLWDVNVSGWENDSATSRFTDEGYQNEYISFVKSVTTKPVVGVGRFTSPDTMVSLVKKGVLDFIGAARPSIADPFLPKKIEEGRIEDIRECIGCNICVTADFLCVPLRCTQNPTMGEEWRRGWHPEKIARKSSEETVLVVGSGPAGIEAAHALGKRGYEVTLAEAGSEVGGHATRVSRLPGLAQWKRAVDYRDYQISQMPNVSLYLESRLSAREVLEFEADHVAIATGSRWAAHGIGRTNRQGIPSADGMRIMTPDDIMAGKTPEGPVVIFDDDYYFMAGILAEKLRGNGHDVTYVTPLADVSHWTHNTMEQERIQTRLMEMGVTIKALHNLASLSADYARLECVYTGKTHDIACGTAVLVTMREADDALYHEVAKLGEEGAAMPKTLMRIGDCLASGTIAASIYAGHRYARELGEPAPEGTPFRRELPALA
ncbi:oxidoreductase [Roseovarius sp. D0-M9]|uniref:oxidoreductase n=1 Tax=Roseovarius sp. D0-M9 TaxID=3127117 RepID=UPI0030104F2B